jgi:hypothetical protein
MSFTPFGKWGGGGVRHLFLKMRRDAAKIMGEMPHLNNFIFVFKNAYTFHSSKFYPF